MSEINLKNARNNLSSLLTKVERGEEIIITRHGKRVAKLVSAERQETGLPSLNQFRAKIKIQGKRLSKTVVDLRDEERF